MKKVVTLIILLLLHVLVLVFIYIIIIVIIIIIIIIIIMKVLREIRDSDYKSIKKCISSIKTWNVFKYRY